AAFSKPSMPGTAFDNLRKSSGFSFVFANPKIAPAPPMACSGLIESCLVKFPTSSGLGFKPPGNCAFASALEAKKQTASRVIFAKRDMMSILFFRHFTLGRGAKGLDSQGVVMRAPE